MRWRLQFTRYVVVGLASNGVLYVLYLSLTHLGIGHKTAMTSLYVLGVLQTFHFNRGWSFGHEGQRSLAFVRYLAAYVFGYALNLFALLLLVDYLGWSHEWVQGAMIVFVAVILFLLQRFWVFRPLPRRSSAEIP
jgi:putative flippase GtrA